MAGERRRQGRAAASIRTAVSASGVPATHGAHVGFAPVGALLTAYLDCRGRERTRKGAVKVNLRRSKRSERRTSRLLRGITRWLLNDAVALDRKLRKGRRPSRLQARPRLVLGERTQRRLRARR